MGRANRGGLPVDIRRFPWIRRLASDYAFDLRACGLLCRRSGDRVGDASHGYPIIAGSGPLSSRCYTHSNDAACTRRRAGGRGDSG
jgi:hypothetical protein